MLYAEIWKLKAMLDNAEIPFEFSDRYYASDGRNELSNMLRGVPCSNSWRSESNG